ncbi:MAG: hypothetical protein ACRYFZ_21545 [Janthinobacterium lividum]
MLFQRLMEFVSFLSGSLLNGFFLLTILLLIGWVVLPKYKQIINQLIVFSNTLLIAGAIVYLLTMLQQVLFQIKTNDEYEAYALVNRITGPYWWAYWGAPLFKGLLPQLLWVKRLRCSLIASLALVPFLLVDYWLPLLYSSIHRDYLPSSWAIMQPNYYGLVIASIVYLIVFLLLFSVMQLIKNR